MPTEPDTQDAQTNYPCRLFCLLARQAPVGLIVRRGPTRWVQLSLWHTDTDEIGYGQWLHGRVPEDRCDLSPDGSLFIYFASKYGRSPFATWTAISRPPYFTALALWPLGDSWSGGGLFVDAQTLLLNHYPIEPPEGHKVSLPPRWLKVKMYRTELGEEYESPLRKRLLRDGWTILQKEVKLPDPHWWRFKLLEPEIIEKRRPDGRYVLLKKYFGGGRHPDGLQYTYKFFLKNIMSGQETLLEGVTWADLDHRQRLVFTKNDGCLYADELQSAEFSPRLIADLNSQCPGAVSTPEWATIWEKQGSQG